MSVFFRAALVLGLTLAPATSVLGQRPRPADSGGHAGHQGHDGPGMPIPMPKGMIMMPGLVGLTPDVTPFLPG
ncbi:MAG: hypothetical protein AB7R55_16630, partial [Gemmatimonadales bacterium]